MSTNKHPVLALALAKSTHLTAGINQAQGNGAFPGSFRLFFRSKPQNRCQRNEEAPNPNAPLLRGSRRRTGVGSESSPFNWDLVGANAGRAPNPDVFKPLDSRRRPPPHFQSTRWTRFHTRHDDPPSTLKHSCLANLAPFLEAQPRPFPRRCIAPL